MELPNKEGIDDGIAVFLIQELRELVIDIQRSGDREAVYYPLLTAIMQLEALKKQRSEV